MLISTRLADLGDILRMNKVHLPSTFLGGIGLANRETGPTGNDDNKGCGVRPFAGVQYPAVQCRRGSCVLHYVRGQRISERIRH